MKNILFFAFLLATFAETLAQQPTDTSITRIVSKENSRIIAAIEKLSDTLKTNLKTQNRIIEERSDLDLFDNTMILSPLIIFFMILLVVRSSLMKEKISLRNILTDKEQEVAIKKEEAKIAIANIAVQENLIKAGLNQQAVESLHTSTEQTNANKTDPPQSTSRFIAFMAGMTSVSIAVCLTSFYFYRWSLGDREVNFSSLSAVLVGLGLGVIPYGFSKLSK